MPETPLSPTLAYSARPTLRIDGQEQPKVSELVKGMTMTELEGGLSALELRFDNVASDVGGGADLAFEDESSLHLGAAVAVYAGVESGPIEIFRGLITGIEAEFSDEGPELTVLAEDAFQLARMARRTAMHKDATIAGLAKDLAGRVGLKPVINGFTQGIGTQVQLNESDLAFLRRLLARYDGDLQVSGAELQVSPRGDVRRGTPEVDMHGQVRRARVLADLSDQATELTVAGWDPALGQRVKGTGRGAHLGPGSGRKGSDLLKDAVGERKEHVGHLAATTDDEARALADAAFDRRARRFVRLEGTTEGNPALRVGTHVKVTGLGPRFSNTYYVVRAVHRFDKDHGYETDFEAECAYLGGP
jgi:hypothetical protein